MLTRAARVAFVAPALVVLWCGVSGAAGAAGAADERPVVYEIPITGPVDPLIAHFARRGLHEARDAHAAAVLVRLDTPGGLDSSMRSIIKDIQASPVPVICWVGPGGARAASAGTFIVVGCPVAAMSLGTNIGAAHPVGLTGDVLSDKVTNDAAAYIRSLAERWDRNAGWAERAVRDSVSVTAREARRLHVIDLIASSRGALLDAVDGRSVETVDGPQIARVAGARIETVHLTLGESILHAFADPNLAFLFFVLGIAGLIYEILHRGLNIPGFVGLVLLVSSLVILSVLPVKVGGLVLLAAAFVFFVIDAKVTAHGIPTVAGIVSLVVGGLYLYDSSVPSARVSRPLLVAVALAVAALFFFVLRAGIKARRSPVRSGAAWLEGAEGIVTEELAPVGRVQVRGDSWRAQHVDPAATPLPVGSRVRVLHVQRLTLDVEALEVGRDAVDATPPRSEVS